MLHETERPPKRNEETAGIAEPRRPVREKFWMPISGEEVYVATAIFCFVHRECGDSTYALADGGEIELRCDRCNVSKGYEVDDPKFRPDARLATFFCV